jgi:hypothetical protein
LWPPKPNELLIASCGPSPSGVGAPDRRNGTAGSCSVMLIVGGDAVADGQDREDRLERAGATEEMTGGGLRRRHRDLVDAVAEHALQRDVLVRVADRRRGRVGVDVGDVVGEASAMASADGARGAVPSGRSP